MKKLILIASMLILIATMGTGMVTEQADTRSRLDIAIDSIVDSVHVDVVRAIIEVESKGDTLAVSPTGDYGIMQVNKAVWHGKYDFSRMNELHYGLSAGYDIYVACLDSSNGNEMLALKKYNGSWAYAKKVKKVMDEQRKA